MATLFGVALLVGIGIVVFWRRRHRESLPAAGIQDVWYEPRRRRFLVAGEADGLRCVVRQTQGDSAPFAEALRAQFPAVFQEKKVSGGRIF